MQRSIEAKPPWPWALGLGLYASAFLLGARAAYFPFAFFLLLSLGALLVLLLHNALSSRWGLPLEPYLYPLARLLPLMGLLGLPFFFLPELFPWARPGASLDPGLAHRSPYLNAPFLLLRYALFFALFALLLARLRPGEHRAEVGAWGLPLAQNLHLPHTPHKPSPSLLMPAANKCKFCVDDTSQPVLGSYRASCVGRKL